MFGHPICLDIPICFDVPYVWHAHIFWMPPVCFDDVWMPPVHTQHKKIMVWLRGVHMPHTFGCPLYVWTPPVCSDGPHMLDTPTYVWITPVCLDISHMFGCPLYVWMMFGYLLYIYNTKIACCVRLRGCPYAPYICMPPVCLDALICMDASCMFWCPHMFGHHSYIWMPPFMFGCSSYVWMTLYVLTPKICLDAPVCLDVPICLDAPTVCFNAPICLDGSLYVWMPLCMFGRCLDTCCTYTTQRKHAFSDWGGVHMSPKHLDAAICLDAPHVCCPLYVLISPYIWTLLIWLDVPYTFGCPHTNGDIHLDAPCMFGHPHIFGHYPYVWMLLIPLDTPYIWGHPNIWGEARHMDSIQTYGGYLNMWGHPTIQRGVQT